MADNLRVTVRHFVAPLLSGTDAAGAERQFLGHPLKPGKLVYREVGEAIRTASRVLDENPHVVAQVRPLRAGHGRRRPALYAVAVARRPE